MQNKVLAVAIIFCLNFLSQVHSAIQFAHSCQPCQISSCQYQNCIRISANGFSKQYCPSLDCSLLKPYTTYKLIGKCEYDFYGSTCSNGVCEFLRTTGCYSDYFSFCPSISTTFGCRQCQETPGCSKCYYQTIYGQNLEICIGVSCNGIPSSIEFSTNSCSTDSVGNSCNCCYSISNMEEKDLTNGICIQGSNYMNDPQLMNFITNKDNGKVKSAVNLSCLLLLIVTLWISF